jgi:hypothetical protein
MKKSQNPSNAHTSLDHGRRDFLSLSGLAAGTLLLATESQAYAEPGQTTDVAITREVSAADSLALYTNLLDEVRRLVLQRDVKLIHVQKYEATEWLAEVISDAKRFRPMLGEGATLTEQNKAELAGFLSQVVFGGNEISRGLIRMRQQPLQEIKDLDTDFDKIRADLTNASNAIKNRNPGIAREGVASAISKLEKYSTSEIERVSKALEEDYQTTLITPSRLQKLLQAVLDLLAAPSPHAANLNHSEGSAIRASYPNSVMIEPALQGSITAVLRAKLNPSSWLQRGIGYAVTFPILLRVSDKNNRIKLLNDALRLVPPGLRNPLLAELANDLANLN